MSQIITRSKEGFLVGVLLPLSPYIAMNGGISQPLLVNACLIIVGIACMSLTIPVGTVGGACLGIYQEFN
jgi:hypothetical protein